MSSLAELGMLTLLEREGLGPVVLRDDIRYRRELRALDRVQVSIELAGLSADGARGRLRHEFVRDDGTLCAQIRTDGAWFHRGSRKITAPSGPTAAVFGELSRTEDFETLPAPRHGLTPRRPRRPPA